MSEGWIPVLRQRRGGGAQGNEARHGVFTIFVDNIPSSMDAKALFKLFTNFGIVNEAFIPYKRRQATNSRFGFVTYDCQVAAAIAIQKENGLLVDDKVLEVKVAAYDRNSRDEQSRGKPQPSRRAPHTNNISGKAALVGHRSFVKVLKGDTPSAAREESIEIQAFEEGNGWLYESAIIRFNIEYPTHIISKALKEKGLEKIECSSSSHPILVYEDHLTYSDSLKHNGLKEFSSIRTCYSEESRNISGADVRIKNHGDEVVAQRQGLSDSHIGEAVDTIVEETPVVEGFNREKEACVEEPLLEGSDRNSKSNDDNLRCIPQVYTSGFIKNFNEVGDELGPGINLEVNLAEEFRKDIGPDINLEANLAHSSNKFLECGPSNRPKELVSNKHGNLVILASSIPHMQSTGPNLSTRKSILTPYHSGQFKPLAPNPKLQQLMKKRGKKKSQLEGFSSFARIHGCRAAAVHKHFFKSVIFRPAASALACSDLSENSSSFNNCLLQEAKDTMHLRKSLGINSNEMEDVALSKIIDLELKDKERIIKEGKAQ
ncbi:hypothetical protein ACSBR2_015527 [Camellia fascicularis]